jgi:hypothetical protein
MVELLIVAGLFLTLLIGMALFVTPSSEYCLNCQQRVKASKGFSWVIFLLLLIFSLGVGAFLYVTYFLFKRKTCTVCGGTNFGESHERHGQSSAADQKNSGHQSDEPAEAAGATSRGQSGASTTASSTSVQRGEAKNTSDSGTEHNNHISDDEAAYTEDVDSVEFFGTPKKKLDSFTTPGYTLSQSKPEYNISTYKHESIIKPAIEKVLNEDSQIQKYKKMSESDWVAVRVGEGSLFIELEESTEKETTVLSVEARGVPDNADYDQLGFSKKFEDLLREDQLPDELSEKRAHWTG